MLVGIVVRDPQEGRGSSLSFTVPVGQLEGHAELLESARGRARPHLPGGEREEHEHQPQPQPFQQPHHQHTETSSGKTHTHTNTFTHANVLITSLSIRHAKIPCKMGNTTSNTKDLVKGEQLELI